MFAHRFSCFVVLVGVACAPLALATPVATPSVCQACNAGDGSYATLESQQEACQACQAQEQSFATDAMQPTPPPPPVYHFNARWYLGVGVGWSRPSTSGQNIFNISSAPDVYEMASTRNSYLYGGDVGLAFRAGAHWFPTGYLSVNSWEIGNFDNNVTHSYAFNNSGSTIYTAKVDTAVYTALLDVSFDVYRWYGLAPFVGIGGGWADASLGGFTENYQSGPGTVTPFTFAGNNNQLATYDAVAGLHYQIGNNWQLQFSYMYLPIGTVHTGTGNTGLVTIPGLSEKITSNNLLLAVHYIF